MLCCIITESVRSTGNQTIQVIQKVYLEVRVFRVYIRKTAHLTCRTFITIAPFVSFDFIKTIGMVQSVDSSCCIDQVLGYCAHIRGGMVRDNVHDHLDAILVRFRAHRLEIRFCTQLIVTNSPVCRLILPPPAAVCTFFRIISHQLHGRIGIFTRICRGCLNRCESCRRYVCHIFPDCIEGPAPAVQNGSVLNIVCKSRIRRCTCC